MNLPGMLFDRKGNDVSAHRFSGPYVMRLEALSDSQEGGL